MQTIHSKNLGSKNSSQDEIVDVNFILENMGPPEEKDKDGAIYNLLNRMKKTNLQEYHLPKDQMKQMYDYHDNVANRFQSIPESKDSVGSQDNSIIAESQQAIKGKMSARFQQEKNVVRTN